MDEKEKISLRVFKIFARYLKGESLSIVLCIVFKIAMYVPTILIPYLWGQALEALTKGDAIRFAKLMIIHTSVYILVHSLISFIFNKLYVRLEIKFVESVSKDMYNKISDLPARAFEEIGVGEFVNRLSEDSDTAIFLLSRLIDMVCKLIVTAVVLTICISTSWILGIEILIFAIIMGFISAKFFPKIQKRQKDIRKENDKLVKISTENITGIREIKALGITSKMKSRVANVLDELYRHSREIRDDENAYYSINNLVYFILQGVILLTSGFLFLQEKLTYSLFIMIETYIWRIDDVVESLSDFGVKYNKVKVSLNRIDEILADRLYSPVQFGRKELRDIEGIIEFKNAYFRYREEEKDTLKGLTLRMEPHKKIAIIGRSGNGKSTIFNLLLRYFDASEGTISIDGENIVDLTEDSLRSNVSIIRQNPFLFNVSIFENFKMLKDDITLEEVREVCKRAYIDEYIMSLKENYDTLIGEGGINLSGGQKQRLAIARTLLLNTKIILFDEATSALDNESEEYIKKTIDELVGEHTIIIVAHRLSTIVDADVIHVIDKGALVGTGTHEELLANNEVYKSLYKKEIR